MTTMILTRYHIHIFAMAIGVGIITKIGSSVKNLQIGDRVGKKDSSWINSQYAHIICLYLLICTYHVFSSHTHIHMPNCWVTQYCSMFHL